MGGDQQDANVVRVKPYIRHVTHVYYSGKVGDRESIEYGTFPAGFEKKKTGSLFVGVYR